MAIQKINYNGKLLPTNTPLFTAQNRAFNYGDGIFETLRIINGKIPFLDYYFNRLKSGLDVLQMTSNNSFTKTSFHSEILKLTSKKNCRVRFTAFRKDGGLYTPQSDEMQFLITAKKLQQESYKLPKKGVNVELFKDTKLVYNNLSPLKSTNSLPYVLAAKYKSIIAADDVLMINNQGRIAEGNSSNLFIWNGKHLLTPRLKEACVAGVIRAVLIDKAKNLGFKIKEGKITIKKLKNAEAVFLTNSIQGVKWVRHFQEKKYKTRPAKKIGKALLEILQKT
ncbi:MAG: aminotransferase class IV [Saprospiraceae bacterium]